MSKLAVCALAKDENAYINEWVSYHLDKGFDTIYLYDNNSSDTPFVGDFIDEKYRDRVVIIDYRDKDMRSRQQDVYNDWLSRYVDTADYCAFIDIDEFIVTEDIEKLVSRMPAECNFMALNWQLFDGGNVIEGDESVPVRERFTRKYGTYKNIWNTCFKSIVRCRKGIIARNAHGFCIKGEDSRYVNCNGDYLEILIGNKFVKSISLLSECQSYIAHYATKSLAEYLKYKVGKIGKIWNNDKGKINYFFRSNRKTPEITAYIENYLKENAG